MFATKGDGSRRLAVPLGSAAYSSVPQEMGQTASAEEAGVKTLCDRQKRTNRLLSTVVCIQLGLMVIGVLFVICIWMVKDQITLVLANLDTSREESVRAFVRVTDNVNMIDWDSASSVTNSALRTMSAEDEVLAATGESALGNRVGAMAQNVEGILASARTLMDQVGDVKIDTDAVSSWTSLGKDEGMAEVGKVLAHVGRLEQLAQAWQNVRLQLWAGDKDL